MELNVNIFFTADTHFNHVLVYECYCPERAKIFSSLDEMNEILIENWNMTVNPEDMVYHLGDFAMGDRNEFGYFRKKLRGQIVLVGGNHDLERGKKKVMIELFGSGNVFRRLVTDLPGLGKTQLIHSPTIWQQERLNHDQRPILSADHKCSFSYDTRDENGWISCQCGTRRRRTERALDAGIDVGLCGHVHQNWRVSRSGRWINVGVDVWDYKPVALDELVMLKKLVTTSNTD
ncbi:MAG: metallophosphoesterase [Oligoflexales bacterium]|nr:metallophosphoesterase [Oligoflexales bacterium]